MLGLCMSLSDCTVTIWCEVSLLTHQPSSLSQASRPVLSSTFSTLPYSSHSTWNCLLSFPLSLTPVTQHGTVSCVFSSLPYSSHSTWNCVFSLFLSPLLQSLNMELCLVFSSLPYSSHSTWNCVFSLFLSPLLQSLDTKLLSAAGE